MNDVVIEFGNPLYQAVLDHFAEGERVPSAEVRKIWQDTTQPGAFDSPVYEDFLNTVRAVNAQQPPGRRLRVLGGDYPVNWGAVSAQSQLAEPLRDRDRSAAAVIRREVLNRDRKALVLFGSAHVYRNRPGTIIGLLEEDSRARWFVVVPAGGPGLPAEITASSATSDEPALLSLSNSAVGDLDAAAVLESGTKRIKIVDGKPLFVDGQPVFVPVFESSIKVRQLADACLYFGSAPPEFVQPPPGLYDGTEYGREVQRRRKLMSPQGGRPVGQ